MRGVERRRREEDRRAPGGPRLGDREAGRLDGPVRPPPRRGVVPRRLTRGLGERVHEVHDARGLGSAPSTCARRRGSRRATRRSARPASLSAGRKSPEKSADCSGSPARTARASAAGIREARGVPDERTPRATFADLFPAGDPSDERRLVARLGSARRCSSARRRSPVKPVPGRRGTRRTAFTPEAAPGASATARGARAPAARAHIESEERRSARDTAGLRADSRCDGEARRARATRRPGRILLRVKEAGGRPGARWAALPQPPRRGLQRGAGRPAAPPTRHSKKKPAWRHPSRPQETRGQSRTSNLGRSQRSHARTNAPFGLPAPQGASEIAEARRRAASGARRTTARATAPSRRPRGRARRRRTGRPAHGRRSPFARSASVASESSAVVRVAAAGPRRKARGEKPMALPRRRTGRPSASRARSSSRASASESASTRGAPGPGTPAGLTGSWKTSVPSGTFRSRKKPFRQPHVGVEDEDEVVGVDLAAQLLRENASACPFAGPGGFLGKVWTPSRSRRASASGSGPSRRTRTSTVVACRPPFLPSRPQILGEIAHPRALGARRDHGEDPPGARPGDGAPRARRREAPPPQEGVERGPRRPRGEEAATCREECPRGPHRNGRAGRVSGDHFFRDWASTTPNAAMFTMSETSTPRWRTWTGLPIPMRIGPIASAFARRQTSL